MFFVFACHRGGLRLSIALQVSEVEGPILDHPAHGRCIGLAELVAVGIVELIYFVCKVVFGGRHTILFEQTRPSLRAHGSAESSSELFTGRRPQWEPFGSGRLRLLLHFGDEQRRRRSDEGGARCARLHLRQQFVDELVGGVLADPLDEELVDLALGNLVPGIGRVRIASE